MKPNLTGRKDTDYIILNNLDDKFLINYCRVNKSANKICKDENFWMNRVLTKFPYLPLNIINRYRGDINWSEYYIDLSKISYDPDRYLREAYESYRLDWIMVALDNGATVNNRTVYMVNRGLEESVYLGNLGVVRFLVEHGAIPNIYPLMGASAAGNLDIVRYLVDNGAPIGRDAVRAAHERRRDDVVDYLVSQGAPDPRI